MIKKCDPVVRWDLVKTNTHENLITNLGGYQVAKAFQLQRALEGLLHDFDYELVDALLAYRRQHNIFEVGDLVVFKDPNNALDKNGLGKGEVLKIKDIDFYDYLIFDCSRYGHGQKWFRHATDKEIEVGHCLP